MNNKNEDEHFLSLLTNQATISSTPITKDEERRNKLESLLQINELERANTTTKGTKIIGLTLDRGKTTQSKGKEKALNIDLSLGKRVAQGVTSKIEKLNKETNIKSKNSKKNKLVEKGNTKINTNINAKILSTNKLSIKQPNNKLNKIEKNKIPTKKEEEKGIIKEREERNKKVNYFVEEFEEADRNRVFNKDLMEVMKIDSGILYEDPDIFSGNNRCEIITEDSEISFRSHKTRQSEIPQGPIDADYDIPDEVEDLDDVGDLGNVGNAEDRDIEDNEDIEHNVDIEHNEDKTKEETLLVPGEDTNWQILFEVPEISLDESEKPTDKYDIENKIVDERVDIGDIDIVPNRENKQDIVIREEEKTNLESELTGYLPSDTNKPKKEEQKVQIERTITTTYTEYNNPMNKEPIQHITIKSNKEINSNVIDIDKEASNNINNTESVVEIVRDKGEIHRGELFDDCDLNDIIRRIKIEERKGNRAREGLFNFPKTTQHSTSSEKHFSFPEKERQISMISALSAKSKRGSREEVFNRLYGHASQQKEKLLQKQKNALKIKPTFQPEIDYNSERMVALKPEKREKEITVKQAAVNMACKSKSTSITTEFAKKKQIKDLHIALQYANSSNEKSLNCEILGKFYYYIGIYELLYNPKYSMFVNSEGKISSTDPKNPKKQHPKQRTLLEETGSRKRIDMEIQLMEKTLDIFMEVGEVDADLFYRIITTIFHTIEQNIEELVMDVQKLIVNQIIFQQLCINATKGEEEPTPGLFASQYNKHLPNNDAQQTIINSKKGREQMKKINEFLYLFQCLKKESRMTMQQHDFLAARGVLPAKTGNAKHNFIPTINSKSRVIGTEHIGKIKKEIKESKKVQCKEPLRSKSPEVGVIAAEIRIKMGKEPLKARSKSPPTKYNRLEYLYEQGNLTERKISKERKTQEERFNTKFKFQPYISPQGKKIKNETADCFTRLREHRPRKKSVEKDQYKPLAEREMEGCTFKPKFIKQEKVVSPTQIAGFDKAIQRHRKVLSEKTKAKEDLEKKITGANYEETLKKAQYIHEFKFQGNERNLEKQLKVEKQSISININVQPGKMAKITLKEGDNPEEVAQEFAMIYQLGQEQKDILIENLKLYMKQYLNKESNQEIN